MNKMEKRATQIFERKATDKELELKNILSEVYLALDEKGLDPIQQIVGYIISDDPTYITSHRKARSLIQKVDRYELLSIVLKKYIGI